MDILSIQNNKTDKGNKIKKNSIKKLSLFSNYSSRQFGSLIPSGQNNYQDINLLLSKNQSKINTSKKSIYGSNSFSTSNILMKSTEENLIPKINVITSNDKIFSKISESAIKELKSIDGRKKSSKLDGGLLKNAVQFFNKILIKENEQSKLSENRKSKNNSSILFEDIINGKNKINKIKKTAKYSPNKIKNTNTFFKFGENKRKSSMKSNDKFLNRFKTRDGSFRKRRLGIFGDRESLKIKSDQEISSDIKKIIRKLSVKDIQNEIKRLKTANINHMMGEHPTKKEINNSKHKSLDHSSISNDLTKLGTILKKKKFNERFRYLFLCNNLYDSLDEDEIETMEKMSNFYIGPNSVSGYIIDSLTLIASLISLVYLPYFLAFSLGNCKFPISSPTYIINIIIEFIYLIDLFTGFFRAYYNFEEVLIIKKRYMSLNYLGNSFIFDLIEAIPFFMIFNNTKDYCNENNGNSNYAFVDNLNYSFLFLKILKIFKSFKNSVVTALDKLLNKSNFFSDWKAIFANIFVIMCALHISSCYFIFLGKNKNPGWILGGLQNESSINIYIASLYYVITTLTTVGYGDITGFSIHERLFQIILLIVGTFSYSWLLTYISNYIKKHNEKYMVYEEKVKILQEIKLSFPNLSSNLYEKIIRYLNYNKNKYKYNIKYVLDSLPSSIQNNLIIEIYKPIIKNFLFFKYFENSDFFVKLVTSMKPILSMKGDILLHEGDIIEDIIFIKKGILNLTIGINLDDPKKYIEEHLGINDKKNTIKKGTGTLTNFTSMSITKFYESNFMSFITSNTKNIKKPEKISYVKKNIRIIALRRNEHFGDVLMILNEKSPVTIKVKSRNAELLFLQKTEATEISNLYPNIWKKIVNKSWHNLNQIKNLIKKKIIKYYELNGIPISAELKNKFIGKKVKFNTKLHKGKAKMKNTKYIKSIIKEEDEIKYISGKNSGVSTPKIKDLSVKRSKENSNKSIKSIQTSNNENKNNNNDLIDRNNNKKDNNNNNEKNLKNNMMINEIKNLNSFLDENNNKILNNLKSNIFKNNNNNIKSNDINKHFEENNFERINEEMFYNDDLENNIMNRHITMDNYDTNNNIFHVKNKKEKDEELISRNNTYVKIEKLLKDNDISTTNYEKVLIDNNSDNTEKGNKKINIYNNIVINHSNKTNTNYNNYNKINRFDYLENISVESFKINSLYENINKLSKYHYAINPALRLKIKNILASTSKIASFKTIQSSKNIKSLSLTDDSTIIKNKNTSFITPQKNRNQLGDFSPMSTKHSKYRNNIIGTTFVGSTLKKKSNKKTISPDGIIDSENNFYTRIKEKSFSKKNIPKLSSKSKKTNNYEEQISKNIEKNTQNLNNPEEYFSGFFTKILTKKPI